MDGIEGMADLRATLAGIKARTGDMAPALLRSGLVVLKAAQDRIDAGGPGWPPNKTHTPILHRTGRLLSSLTAQASGNVMQTGANEIEVGTNVEYAPFLQFGTRRMPARPFLFIDQQVSDKVADIFAKFIMTGKAA